MESGWALVPCTVTTPEALQPSWSREPGNRRRDSSTLGNVATGA
jgi:hypothetical protein